MCYSTVVIPFRVDFRPGISLYEQVVYAATKAVISGKIRPGDPFPSVRTLSKELKINPNTAHKVVMHLVGTGLLETRPGIGTVVARLPEASSSARMQLLGREIEELVVEAKKLRISLGDVVEAMTAHWEKLGGKIEKDTKSEAGGRAKR